MLGVGAPVMAGWMLARMSSALRAPPFTGTSHIVKQWLQVFLHSGFGYFLDKRYYCIGVRGSGGKTRNRLHIYRRPCCTGILPCGPRYEPLSGAPFISRGVRRNRRHKGGVELARCRSDLFTASSNSRLAGPQQTFLKSALTGFGSWTSRRSHIDLHHGPGGLHAHVVGIERLAAHEHRPQDACVLVG